MVKKFSFKPDLPNERGRFTVFAQPHPEKTYVIGLDGGYGLPDGDYDAAQILDSDGEQAAVMAGRWGPAEFEQRLIPVLDWYDPFIVGERQVLLPVLRNLYDAGRWVYFHRREDARGRSVRDSLGHHSAAGDLRVSTLQEMLCPRDSNGLRLPNRIKIHDKATHSQLCRFGYRPRSSRVTMEGARDKDLSVGAPQGEHDDLVSALQMAAMGMRWMASFERPKKRFADSVGTMGQILEHDEVWEDDEDAEPISALAAARAR